MNPFKRRKSSEKNMPISSKREKGRIWKSNHTSLNKFEGKNVITINWFVFYCNDHTVEQDWLGEVHKLRNPILEKIITPR